MTDSKDTHGEGHIAGVSLSSFLQMLEQESKSCTLIVKSGDQQGFFYFNEGILVDAQNGREVGLNAAYAILLWDSPVFTVTSSEDRMQRIQLPLAHILLDSAKQKDEGGMGPEAGMNLAGDAESFFQDPVEQEHPDPAIQRLIQSITSIGGIKHYFLLSRQGKMITQSSKQLKMGDFIAYCIVSGIQMRNVLDVKGPSRIEFALENGETLLIFPGAGMIIGLLLDGEASIDDVTGKLGNLLANR